MGFWIFMMVMNLLIPATMIGFGKLFLKTAPKEINGIFGYRTSMSMKNRETWEFAHHHFGKRWFFLGIFLLPVTIFLMLPVLGKADDTVGFYGGFICLIQCVVMLLPIISTERSLRKHFDEDGRRK